MIASLFRRRKPGPDIDRLYGAIMATALSPGIFARHGAPDTFEGRFESATLHMTLALLALRKLPPPAEEASQALIDRFFEGIDAAMRQIGIGDTGVPRRMKKFLQAFYGRLQAYERALAPDAPEAALSEAIGRNLMEGAAVDPALVAHVRFLRVRLSGAALPDLLDRPETFFQADDGGSAK